MPGGTTHVCRPGGTTHVYPFRWKKTWWWFFLAVTEVTKPNVRCSFVTVNMCSKFGVAYIAVDSPTSSSVNNGHARSQGGCQHAAATPPLHDTSKHCFRLQCARKKKTAQMLPVYFILLLIVYILEYRVHFVLRVLRVWSTGGLNTASTGSVSRTEGPNTASTGSMSSTDTPRLSNAEILWSAGRIRSTEPRNTASTRSIYWCIFCLPSTLQLLDKLWSQVSSLLPPGTCLSVFIAHRVQHSHCSSFFIGCC